MTERQKQILTMYHDGYKCYMIAKKLGIDKSTVSRTLHRALKCKCPFSIDCLKCPLPECAIKDEYFLYVNNNNLDLRKKESKENYFVDL